MIEFFRHFLGLCGEHGHPNIFTSLLGGSGLVSVFYYIKYKIQNVRNNR